MLILESSELHVEELQNTTGWAEQSLFLMTATTAEENTVAPSNSFSHSENYKIAGRTEALGYV